MEEQVMEQTRAQVREHAGEQVERSRYGSM